MSKKAKGNGIIFLYFSIAIVTVAVIITLLRKRKTISSGLTSATSPGSNLNVMNVSTDGVIRANGLLWSWHVNSFFISNVNDEKPSKVVQGFIDYYKRNPALYDEVSETAIRFKTNDLALLIVENSIEQASLMGLIEPKTAM